MAAFCGGAGAGAGARLDRAGGALDLDEEQRSAPEFFSGVGAENFILSGTTALWPTGTGACIGNFDSFRALARCARVLRPPARPPGRPRR